ncbi:putative Heterokaryon incompatibility domain-containing protein [Seiridium cardinale]|uniref:Heterokaryon incompatibility domain-containing protein n=1 Tax=Seiridium cardinale TaxID=138064 RepID=A0ABR2XHI7_9PEZI
MASADLQEAFLSKQLPATADAIHDLSSDVTMQEGAKVGKVLQDAHKEKKYSKEILSDRNHEHLSLLLQSDTEDDQQTVAKALEEDHRKGFNGTSIITSSIIGSLAVPAHSSMTSGSSPIQKFFLRMILGNSVPSMPTRIDFSSLWEVVQEEADKFAFCGLLWRKIVENGSVNRMKDHDFGEVGLYINVIDEGPEYRLRIKTELEFPEAATERFLV